MRLLQVSGFIAVLAVGCVAPATQPAAPQEPPYTLVDEGHMRVRADLWPRLATARAERSDVTAEIEGVGHLEFAPDAAYAVRVPFPAYVEAVHVAAGAQVRTNEPLATLRSGEVARLRSEVRRLTATLSAQRDAVTRFKSWSRRGCFAARAGRGGGGAGGRRGGASRGAREPAGGPGRPPGRGPLHPARERRRPGAAAHLDPGERVTPEDDDPAFLIGDAVRLIATAAFPEHEAASVREGPTARSRCRPSARSASPAGWCRWCRRSTGRPAPRWRCACRRP
ncbi:hypothetical protein [Nannocystis pusilla]|uniref:hypothetical protein n=1 Tax=Nannocystis pusilla TaxID=889268 RepID=UPI003B814759